MSTPATTQAPVVKSEGKVKDEVVATEPATKKRKRTSSRKSKIPNPLNLRDETNLFVIKRKIMSWNTEHNSFVIPKLIKKQLRTIVRHDSVIEDPEMEEQVLALFRKRLNLECCVYIGNLLQYYRVFHNLGFRNQDIRLIERAQLRPARTNLEALDLLMKSSLCGLEDTHHYYSKYLNSGGTVVLPASKPGEIVVVTAPAPKINGPKKAVKKRKKQIPFNLYIKDSWLTRNDELRIVSGKTGVSSVMTMLAGEWRAHPEYKVKYVKMAAEANAALALKKEDELQSSSSVEPVDVAVV
jgi:hypothetical protein